MSATKEDFIKNYLPETVVSLEMSQMNLDVVDLSIADIMRNLNKIYPPNSRNRNAIEGGEMAVGVICRTETIHPYKGMFLLLSKNGIKIDMVQSKYLILSFSIESIESEEAIGTTIDRITSYIVSTFRDELRDLPDFYRKFIYNDSEYYHNGFNLT